jgi:hypothetical protein
MRFNSILLFVCACLLSVSGFASDPIPDCMDHGQILPLNNAQVLSWKSTTANQFLARGHISGTLGKIYPDHSGHNHFQVIIGSNPNDTIEVIYNQSFGALAPLNPGSVIEACGDYITSNAASKYPASPDGAILHWVHKGTGSHDGGYVDIDGDLDGQGL